MKVSPDQTLKTGFTLALILYKFKFFKIWIYLMFYDHLSGHSLLAKLGNSSTPQNKVQMLGHNVMGGLLIVLTSVSIALLFYHI